MLSKTRIGVVLVFLLIVGMSAVREMIRSSREFREARESRHHDMSKINLEIVGCYAILAKAKCKKWPTSVSDIRTNPCDVGFKVNDTTLVDAKGSDWLFEQTPDGLKIRSETDPSLTAFVSNAAECKRRP